ncbi:hypothetical protein KEM55_003204 [Ascosphaera atra]|nr:hypothetical protein KEM55_003204 [Ascosphaera atra]
MDAETGGGGTRNPRFEGEDTTPTTKRELRGWYAYGIAAEVFAAASRLSPLSNLLGNEAFYGVTRRRHASHRLPQPPKRPLLQQ